MPPILFALFSNISFATASYFYTDFSRKISSEWMNFYKAFVAAICFFLTCTLFGLFGNATSTSVLLLLGSGIFGLMIGDIFLLKAFVHLGSGRTLMVFGFQPLILGVSSFFLFGQVFTWWKLVAILFLMACLFAFSLESFRSKGHWDFAGLVFALTGVLLDAIGILMTRKAFELSPELSPFYANFLRAIVTVIGFVIMSRIPMFRLSLVEPLLKLTTKKRLIITAASFLGTFMSLSFYLQAVKTGHLASVSAVAGTSPLFATLIETMLGRKKLTPYLIFGTIFFVCGFLILTLG